MSRSKLHDLIALAQEPSSAKRRELLREVTDLFFAPSDGRGAAEDALFDTVLSQLAGDMEEAVRAELAARMAAAPQVPPTLLRALAQDSIAVAAPILSGAANLKLDDQMAVARNQGQDHLRALSLRPGVSMTVTDVIAQRADDTTLDVLLRNESAQLSRQTQEIAVDRAASNPALHDAVVDRASLPADLLNEMYFMVEGRLRDRIMARNAEMDPAALDAALAAGRTQVAARDGALPPRYAEMEAEIRGMIANDRLQPGTLASMLRDKDNTRFLIALSELAQIDFHTARRILDQRELDALSIVCKAAEFDRALFLTFAVLILGPEGDAMGRARGYGDLYDDLPKETALRTVRFWRMRRATGDVQAA